MKILISGGHLTPALAVCDYVLQHYPQDGLVFVGRIYSQDALKQKSHERSEVEKRHIPFIPFSAPRLSENTVFQKILAGPQFIASLFQAMGILRQQRPDVFLSFGGYLALPLAFACWLLRIPVVTHEQTRTLGEANKIIAKVAEKIAVTFPESAHQLPSHKVVVTGNPIRQELLESNPPQPSWANFTSRRPLLYVTGGNQGSHFINTIVGETLAKLLKDWVIVHQCGNPTLVLNYKTYLEKQRSLLENDLQKSYVVKEWLSTTELNWVYRHACCVLSRAGANTISELTALQVPGVLIPLAFSHHDEQNLNAEWLAKQGGAMIIPQKELTAEVLIKTLRKVKSNADEMKQNLRHITQETQAVEQLYQVLTTVIQ